MKKVIAVFIALGLFTGVVYSEKIEITGVDREAVITVADSIADSILKGYNDDDYTAYSRDFDERMKNQLTRKVYKQMRELIMSKIGRYESRTVSKVYTSDQYTIIEYTAKFELEDGVNVKVVMQKYGKKYLVSGLWFNSPKLRE